MGSHLSVGKKVKVEGKKYKIKRRIGEGGFAFVFLVKEKKSKELFALKQTNIQDDEMLERVKKEAEVMKSLSPHPNIVQYRADYLHLSKSGKRRFLLLMEFCSGGSLLEQVNEFHESGQRFSQLSLLSIFEEICKGVEHMHSQQPAIIHRDLKIENILFQNDRYKICDFGSCTTTTIGQEKSSQQIRECEEDIERFTTLEYRAPEMIDLHQGYPIDERVDIWALGCILYTMAFHVHPFPGGKLQILNAKYELPAHSPYTASVNKILQSVFVVNPTDRPRIDKVIALVQNVLWEKDNAVAKENGKDETVASAAAVAVVDNADIPDEWKAKFDDEDGAAVKVAIESCATDGNAGSNNENGNENDKTPCSCRNHPEANRRPSLKNLDVGGDSSSSDGDGSDYVDDLSDATPDGKRAARLHHHHHHNRNHSSPHLSVNNDDSAAVLSVSSPPSSSSGVTTSISTSSGLVEDKGNEEKDNEIEKKEEKEEEKDDEVGKYDEENNKHDEENNKHDEENNKHDEENNKHDEENNKHDEENNKHDEENNKQDNNIEQAQPLHDVIQTDSSWSHSLVYDDMFSIRCGKHKRHNSTSNNDDDDNNNNYNYNYNRHCCGMLKSSSSLSLSLVIAAHISHHLCTKVFKSVVDRVSIRSSWHQVLAAVTTMEHQVCDLVQAMGGTTVMINVAASHLKAQGFCHTADEVLGLETRVTEVMLQKEMAAHALSAAEKMVWEGEDHFALNEMNLAMKHVDTCSLEIDAIALTLQKMYRDGYGAIIEQSIREVTCFGGSSNNDDDDDDDSNNNNNSNNNNDNGDHHLLLPPPLSPLPLLPLSKTDLSSDSGRHVNVFGNLHTHSSSNLSYSSDSSSIDVNLYKDFEDLNFSFDNRHHLDDSPVNAEVRSILEQQEGFITEEDWEEMEDLDPEDMDAAVAC